MTAVVAGRAASAPRLILADDRDAGDLAAYLARLLRYDRTSVVRLQVRGAALGVFAQPPFGVIALRAVPLAVHAQRPDHLDTTVAAAGLLNRVTDGAVPDSRHRGDGGVAVDLPPQVTGPSWTGLLPPQTGWEPIAAVPAPVLLWTVRAAVAEFRQRTAAIAESERTRARLDGVAEDVWSRPVLAGMPLRAAHAAQTLGFLHHHGDASIHRVAGWLRLDGRYGSVAVRSGPGNALSLRVVNHPGYVPAAR